ncbi:MAG: hypothetical protein ACI8ZX_001149 [Planctomycetota bacterium]|jgi:hypothetical protein
MKKYLIYILLLLIFSSCFKEEDKWNVSDSNSSFSTLGSDYSNQVFYNLSSQSIVSENKWTIWDLAFYAQENDYYIKLNDAANMKVFKAEGLSFENTNAIDNNWDSKVDYANGDRTKIALNYSKNSESSDTIYYNEDTYIIKLGIDGLGQDMGIRKFQLLYTYQKFYVFRYSNLDGSELITSMVEKDQTLNYTYFSFSDGGKEVIVEPDKSTWDLLFSRTTDMAISNDLSDTIFDYSVVSVLLNSFSAKSYRENEISYEDQKIQNIDNTLFSSTPNTIGYYWKYYNLEESQYSIIENQHYLVKDFNNYYYKFKILSFYDPETNNKGTIGFEYQLL